MNKEPLLARDCFFDKGIPFRNVPVSNPCSTPCSTSVPCSTPSVPNYFFSFAIALDLERLFLHCHILRGSTIGKASERIRDEKSTFPRFASLALFPLERMSLASRSIRTTDPHLIESKLFLKVERFSPFYQRPNFFSFGGKTAENWDAALKRFL